MAGGSEGLAALKAHLLKGAYEETSKLSDVTAFVQYWHSSLDIQLVEVAAEHGEPAVGDRLYSQISFSGLVNVDH